MHDHGCPWLPGANKDPSPQVPAEHQLPAFVFVGRVRGLSGSWSKK